MCVEIEILRIMEMFFGRLKVLDTRAGRLSLEEEESVKTVGTDSLPLKILREDLVVVRGWSKREL